MRGCLILLIGIGVGIGIMVLVWPATPTGSILPQSADVRVSLSDGYMMRIIRARLSSTGIVSIRNLEVRSAPPVLMVRANAGIGPVSAPVTVELQPEAAGGTVGVRIIATRVGVVPIPNVLTGLVTESINDSLRRAVGTRAYVTGVTVTLRGLDISANYP